MSSGECPYCEFILGYDGPCPISFAKYHGGFMFDAILPDNNPKTAFGAAKTQYHLIPVPALQAEAIAMAEGARKYGAYNWREKTVSSSTYQSAALRHLLAWFDGEDSDPETGASHLGHARACLGFLLDAMACGKLNDDRPKK